MPWTCHDYSWHVPAAFTDNLHVSICTDFKLLHPPLLVVTLVSVSLQTGAAENAGAATFT